MNTSPIMRNLIALLLFAFSSASSAQDYEQLMRAHMQPQGITMEPNNDPYEPLDFTGSFRMEIEIFKNGATKGEQLSARYALKDDKMSVEMKMGEQPEPMRMLYDLRGKWNYVMVSDGEKRTAMKMRMMKMTKAGATAEPEKSTFERTDAMKTIEGHGCRKYLGSNSKGNWEAWVAEDVKLDVAKAMRQISGDKDLDQWQGLKDIGGMALEMVWTKKDASEKMNITVHDLQMGSVDEALFSLDGYSVMEMPSMPR
ncbi:MAG: DUF4412 domain-containing protein [Flavobacteriales bacterium]|nr:DUF4412 domain-containing protein [Flavobacteriales bacterium]MBK7754047.1 DUF4412 domain-containing protein [Flavobacteriales bacterium]